MAPHDKSFSLMLSPALLRICKLTERLFASLIYFCAVFEFTQEQIVPFNDLSVKEIAFGLSRDNTLRAPEVTNVYEHLDRSLKI